MKSDLVVIPMPARVSNIAAHADMRVEWFAADYKFRRRGECPWIAHMQPNQIS
ncbi:MAG: hypothetical protein IJP74_00730 [Prevotella sp.]|nr:hypothetical protein [Prevotella sp.]